MENLESQEIKRKKRYLKRYKKNLNCIKRLEARVSDLNDKLNSLSSPSFSDMPRGGTPVTKAELITNKIELEERIKRFKAKSDILRCETLAEIDKLTDIRYIEVLESIYIDCRDIDDTADHLGYHRRHIERLESGAIKELTEL